jgi:hypothetical protein
MSCYFGHKFKVLHKANIKVRRTGTRFGEIVSLEKISLALPSLKNVKSVARK